MKQIGFIFWGATIGLFALALETISSIIFSDVFGIDFSFDAYFFLIVTALIEEALLFFAVWKIFYKTTSLRASFGRVLFLGTGFALLEIFLNSLSGFNYSSTPSYLGLILLHILTPLLYSYFFFRPEKNPALAPFLLLCGFFLHLLYNFSVQQNFNPLVTDLALLILIASSILSLFAKQKSFLAK